MDSLIAAIYGTHGTVKVASPGGGAFTLADLAAYTLAEFHQGSEDMPLEKIASAHGSLLQDFVDFDMTGRGIAQQQFSEMEAAALAGDSRMLEAFFS